LMAVRTGIASVVIKAGSLPVYSCLFCSRIPRCPSTNE
jgi:hypothetical protein